MFDVCIIGAGIVGCAITRELAQRNLSVALVEKHTTFCQETSGHNSNVIHSGFHEIPGTLKSRLTLEGSRQILEYAERHSIQLLRTGMLIAIPSGSISAGLWKETGALLHLWRQGRRQNLSFRFVITHAGVRKIAPIHALGGIFIPSVCVIDVPGLARTFLQQAESAGAQMFFGSEVGRIAVDDTNHLVQTTSTELKARVLVNAAGLRAHEVSVLAGGPAYDMEFIRGDYYELVGGISRWNIRTLVYPAMPPLARSKGIHFGPRTDGRLYLGPSATPVSQEPDKELFLEAARKFLPDIREEDLQWAYCGIRPKRSANIGTSDFGIQLDRATPPLINLIGIDSPGLSASMAIAHRVAEVIRSVR